MFGELDCIAYKTAGLSVRNDMAIAIIYTIHESLIRHNANQYAGTAFTTVSSSSPLRRPVHAWAVLQKFNDTELYRRRKESEAKARWATCSTTCSRALPKLLCIDHVTPASRLLSQ